MVHQWVLELLRKLIACSRRSLIDGTVQKKWWWGGVGGESVPSSPPVLLLTFFPLSDVMLHSTILMPVTGLKIKNIKNDTNLYSILLPAKMFLRMIESSVILR